MAEPTQEATIRRTGIREPGGVEIIGERWQLPNKHVTTALTALEYHARSETLGAGIARELFELLAREPLPEPEGEQVFTVIGTYDDSTEEDGSPQRFAESVEAESVEDAEADIREQYPSLNIAGVVTGDVTLADVNRKA